MPVLPLVSWATQGHVDSPFWASIVSSAKCEKNTYSKETLWRVERLYEYCLMQCLTSRLYSTNGHHHSSFLSTNLAFCFQGVSSEYNLEYTRQQAQTESHNVPFHSDFSLCPGMTWGRYASTIYSKRAFHPNTSSTTFFVCGHNAKLLYKSISADSHALRLAYCKQMPVQEPAPIQSHIGVALA